MNQQLQPAFALCSTRTDQVGYFPPFGRIEAREWDADPKAPGGIRGLLWGNGDPVLAGLDWDEWAVVRIDDAAGPVKISNALGENENAAVKFQFGTVIFAGNRRGAIETLIQHGANPDAMAVQLALPSEDGIADADCYGIAVGGRGGIARGAEYSHALTGNGGFSVAGDFGEARTLDTKGVAAVASNGAAYAGDEGLAIARGWRSHAAAGQGGTAIAIEEFCSLSVSDGGLVIALRDAEYIDGGRNSVAIVRHAVEGRTTVSLGEGSIAILDLRKNSEEAPSFALAHFGPGGLQPNEPYVFLQGTFQKLNLNHERRQERRSEREREKKNIASNRPSADIAEITYGKPFEKMILSFDRPLGTDILVLCSAFYDDDRHQLRDRGEVYARSWNPDPSSSEGIFGLAWGAGNPSLAGLHFFSDEFLLVRVDQPVFVPLSDPALSGELVKFSKGEIVFRGSIGEAFSALAGSGADLSKFPGKISCVGDGGRVRVSDFGVARAGRKGFAIAGHGGDAQVGPDGVAIVSGCGIARADVSGIAAAWGEGRAIAGNRGVAISDTKRHGRSAAGAGGVAVAMGTRSASAHVGRGGAAILRCSGGVAHAGDDGIVFGGCDSRISVGRNGIAVSREGKLDGEPGSLLVLFGPEGRLRTAVVDERGNVPWDFAN